MLASFALVLAVQAPKIDPAAMALLEKNRDATFALQGYRAECRIATKNRSAKPGLESERYVYATLASRKPDLSRCDTWILASPEALLARPEAPADVVFGWNGKSSWVAFGDAYRKSNAAPVPQDMKAPREPWRGFFSTEDSAYAKAIDARRRKELVSVLRKGQEQIDGLVCDRVEIASKSESQGGSTQTRSLLFLRPDGLVRRRIGTSVSEEGTSVETADLVRIEKDPDLSGTSFDNPPRRGAGPKVPQETA